MTKITLSICVFLALAGCATSQIKPQRNVSKTIYSPELDVETVAEIGQTLVSKSNLISYSAIILEANSSEFFKTPALANSYSGTITVNSGILRKYRENESGSYFVDKTAKFKFALGTAPCDGIACTAGIFVPSDPTKQPSIFKFEKGTYSIGTTPVSIRKTTDYVWSTDSFKRELVYGGVSQKTISVSYREFYDGIARPSFSQDLKYDLTEGDVIGYRGARFQVIKANNIEIRYKVLKQLD